MEKLVINGGHSLEGTLTVGGSKNTALPLMAAALLADGESTFYNMPVLRDVHTFGHVLRITGCNVVYKPDDDPSTPETMTIDATNIHYPEAPYELVKKMRASFYMLGALMGRCGSARVSLPGGCAWGPRPVDLHMDGIRALGAELELEQGYVIAKAPSGGLPGGTFRLEPSSVGATINIMLAAVTANGGSSIENAAREPDVVVFGEALQEMGAKIHGLGSPTIEIEGVDQLNPITFTNCADRIEIGTYMILAAMCGKPDTPVHLEYATDRHLGEDFKEAFRETGADFDVQDDSLYVTAPEELKPVSIETGVYPGFPTDLQAQWTVMLTQAPGQATVTDNIYTDRFAHIPELQRLDAQLDVKGNSVTVRGGNGLKGARVMSTDLRASVSLVMAGIAAEGSTEVLRVYHLDRGYEDLEGKLSGAGIPIHREEYEEFQEPANA